MSTLIKRNGAWVKVAGHTVWMGTKNQLSAALEAGELPDNTEVMVTNDYDGSKETDWIEIPLDTVEHVTFGKSRQALSAPIMGKRVGKTLYVKMTLYIDYDNSGAIPGWTDFAMIPETLLADNEVIESTFVEGWHPSTSEDVSRPAIYFTNNLLKLEAHTPTVAYRCYFENIWALPIKSA